MRQLLRVTTVLVFFVCVGTAKADSNRELYYVLTGPRSAIATFYLPVNPNVGSGNVNGTFGFTVTPMDLTVDGSADPTGDVTFYDITFGGGLTVDAGDVFDLINPSSSNIALFVSETETAPTMLYVSGDIPLDDFMTGAGAYTLTITPVPTPEPASLLLAGVGLLSLLAKRLLTKSL